MRLVATLFLFAFPAFGAISVVNTAVGNAYSGTAITAISTGSFVATTGNLLVVFERHATSSTATTSVTDTAGNTFTLVSYASPSATDRSSLWYAKNIVGNAADVVTATKSVGTGFSSVQVTQLSGADTSSPFDTFAVGVTTTAATSVTTSAFSTSAASTVLVAGGSIGALSSTFTSGAGYTLQATDSASAMETRIVSSIQSAVTCTLASSNNSAPWELIVAAFKAASTAISSSQTFVF